MITNTVRPLVNEIFYLGARSPILAFKKVGSLLQQYNTSDKHDKISILEHIAKVYHPDEEKVTSQVRHAIQCYDVRSIAILFIIIDSKNLIVKFY
jgi:hypothetical protein